MKQMTPYLKKQLKGQMLKPLQKCEMFQAYCRFAIPGYCLAEFRPFSCDFVGTKRKEMETFKPRVR